MEHSITMGAKGSMTAPNFSLLLEALNSDELPTYLEAREALLEQGQAALPILVDLMLRQTDRQGWRAASLLAAMKEAATVPAFVQALKSPNPLIRQIAAQMLGDSGDEGVVLDLLASLSDPNPGVQTWVVESLGKLRARSAVKPLCAIISATDSTELQQSIIKALGRIGDPEAAGCLLPFMNSPNHHVRTRACEIYPQLTRASIGSSSCT